MLKRENVPQEMLDHLEAGDLEKFCLSCGSFYSVKDLDTACPKCSGQMGQA